MILKSDMMWLKSYLDPIFWTDKDGSSSHEYFNFGGSGTSTWSSSDVVKATKRDGKLNYLFWMFDGQHFYYSYDERRQNCSLKDDLQCDKSWWLPAAQIIKVFGGFDVSQPRSHAFWNCLLNQLIVDTPDIQKQEDFCLCCNSNGLSDVSIGEGMHVTLGLI